MSAELAAIRTAAAAALADYQRDMPAADVADRALRGAYMADMLGHLLAQLGGETPDPAAGQLAQIRLVLDAFDWEHDDRQYALEQIDDILRGDR